MRFPHTRRFLNCEPVCAQVFYFLSARVNLLEPVDVIGAAAPQIPSLAMASRYRTFGSVLVLQQHESRIQAILPVFCCPSAPHFLWARAKLGVPAVGKWLSIWWPG